VAEVKALLETGELILRGEIRRRVPFSEITSVTAQSDSLRFRVGREAVELVLGAAMAAKWAEVITTPPPSLARKLGINGGTVVRVVGDIEDEDLIGALAEAARVTALGANLMVACVDTPESLHAAYRQAREALKEGAPIWVVYAKGPGHALNEEAIRTFLRGHGLMDTKVASVSAKLTALRFILQKSK
jgi:class 3 adenylate cyclase